jgi:hypothetical protein
MGEYRQSRPRMPTVPVDRVAVDTSEATTVVIDAETLQGNTGNAFVVSSPPLGQVLRWYAGRSSPALGLSPDL